MLLIIFIIAMPDQILAAIALLLIYTIFSFFTKKIVIRGRPNFYTAILLAFLMAGAGIAYLGEFKKGRRWFLVQCIAFIVSSLLPLLMFIESKYLGLIIVAPFVLQLIETAIDYKGKYGDIDLF